MIDAEYFVNVLKQVVRDQGVNNLIENLESPPGRQPVEELLSMSQFYKNLDSGQKAIFEKIIRMVTDDILFGVLCVLDGVRAIESGEDKGVLELLYRKHGLTVLLNDPEEEFLHDLL